MSMSKPTPGKVYVDVSFTVSSDHGSTVYHVGRSADVHDLIVIKEDMQHEMNMVHIKPELVDGICEALQRLKADMLKDKDT